MANVENLLNQIQIIDTEISKLQALIAAAPSGKLISRIDTSGNFKYAKKIRLEDGNFKETYLNRNSLAEAKLYADKLYCEARISDLKEKKKYIETTIKHLQYNSQEQKLFAGHPGIAALLSDKTQKTDITCLNWANAPYERNKNHPERLIYPTVIPGLTVRNKAEADIAAALSKYGVPFHYDEIVNFNGKILAIDFICMNRSTHKQFYWDHRGMMNNSDYVQKVMYCENVFLQSGIILGKNLIVTTETSDSPLDLQWVDQLIEYYLV